MTKQPHDTSVEMEMIFSTQGTSLEDTFEGLEIEDDCDDVEEDDYSSNDY